jgi:hypothetical protein
MTPASHLQTRATPTGWPRPQPGAWAGYAAAAWALAFAAPHFYWGAGGVAERHTCPGGRGVCRGRIAWLEDEIDVPCQLPLRLKG